MLVVGDTELGIIDRVIDLRLASLSRVTIDMVVVTPYELANTFSTSSFGRVTALLRRGFGFPTPKQILQSPVKSPNAMRLAVPSTRNKPQKLAQSGFDRNR